MRRYIFLAFSIALAFLASPARAQDFKYSVKHHHTLKDCRGALNITSDGVEYFASKTKDSRRWTWNNIRTLEVESPMEISIVTYEDQKRWAGKDKVFRFTLLDKRATPELAAFLLKHVKRPMEISVIPEDSEKPTFEIPVKHLRMVTGTQGVLRIYSDKVVYQTEVKGDSRYWRISDIQRFSQPDRFRFQIVGYLPKAGGPTEDYNFQLFEDPPAGLYDYLWVRLHPSSYYPDVRQ